MRNVGYFRSSVRRQERPRMPLVGKGQKGIKELRGRGPAVEGEAETQRMKGSGSGRPTFVL